MSLLADDGNFISINKTTGFEIGKNGNASLVLQVFCANKTTKEELAVEFSMNLNAIVNLTSDNYYIYLNIPYFYVSEVEVLNDKVGMWARDYNMFLSALMMTLVTDVNQKFRVPYDMRTIWPDFMMMITHVFTYPRLSTMVQDEYVYLGLSYFMDWMSFSVLQSQSMIEDHIFQ